MPTFLKTCTCVECGDQFKSLGQAKWCPKKKCQAAKRAKEEARMKDKSRHEWQAVKSKRTTETSKAKKYPCQYCGRKSINMLLCPKCRAIALSSNVSINGQFNCDV